MLASGAAAVSSLIDVAKSTIAEADRLQSIEIARSHAAQEEVDTALLPWQTLSEQFAILEPELKARILLLPQDQKAFTAERARQCQRTGSILPHVLAMASAAMAADPELGALRFRLVPQRLSEEDFWRCFFWSVAQIKLELCNDFATTNRVRQQAVLASEAEALLDAPSPGATHKSCDSFQFDLAELDAEFEALVGAAAS